MKLSIHLGLKDVYHTLQRLLRSEHQINLLRTATLAEAAPHQFTGVVSTWLQFLPLSSHFCTILLLHVLHKVILPQILPSVVEIVFVPAHFAVQQTEMLSTLVNAYEILMQAVAQLCSAQHQWQPMFHQVPPYSAEGFYLQALGIQCVCKASLLSG